MQPVKTYLFDTDKNTFEKVIWHWTFDSYLAVQNSVKEKYREFKT